MLVCHCNSVSERAIRRAVRDGAATLSDVGHACGAGACCGGCHDTIHGIIHAESQHGEMAPAAPLSLPSVTPS